ncbi:serine/threonine-protein kinase [Streptomyces sp. NPDC048442]|uniref:serine/threonine-protein kinase n=1 Tax=Streptomyces sp. NPDC048442 TaxID=3154823 RepID=UPI0034426798
MSDEPEQSRKSTQDAVSDKKDAVSGGAGGADSQDAAKDAGSRNAATRDAESGDAGVRDGVSGNADADAVAGGAGGAGAAGAAKSGSAGGRGAKSGDAGVRGAKSGSAGVRGAKSGSAGTRGAGDAEFRDAESRGALADEKAAAEAARDAASDTSKEVEGRLLAGRYRLGDVLGRGGMGTVWRAVDETLGRTVAVKELRFPTAIDEDEKRRLITRTLREAKAIARIRNNSAVTVFDVVDEDDRPWIVMELVEGKSLAEAIREDGLLTPRRAAEVGLAILDVLRAAHRQGILHRDVKPSNVLIAEDGRVVLTDFGIAQVEGDPSITSTGMLVGAPSYISPERARGHKPGPAADMWSLGGLIYASVEGVPPYDKGSAIATLTAVMTEPVDPPKNAGPLEEVIYGLLVKDPAQRLDDAGARALLNDVLTQLDKADEAGDELARSDATKVVPLPPLPPVSAEPKAPRTTKEPRSAKAPRTAKAKKPAAVRMEKPAKAAPAAAAAVPVAPAVAGPAAAMQSSGSGSGGGGTSPGTVGGMSPATRKRALLVVALVAALAVLGTVIALALNKDTPGDEGKNGTSTSGGATAGGSKNADKDPDKGKGTDPDKGNGAGGGTGGNTGKTKPPGGPSAEKPAGDAVPAGFTTVSDSQFHFSMAMPDGYRKTAIAGQNSGGIYNKKDGGFPRVQVDFNGSPGTDAAAAWAKSVATTAALSTNFDQIGIRPVSYNGYPTTADWEFKRDQKGQRVHVLNRGFRVDATHGYSIMVSCPDAEWNGAECTKLRDTAFATFKPTD